MYSGLLSREVKQFCTPGKKIEGLPEFLTTAVQHLFFIAVLLADKRRRVPPRPRSTTA
jgi:hypothetical protein